MMCRRDDLDRLRSRLEAPLPGCRAQEVFEPELAYGRHFGPPPHDVRRAAVVALVYPHDDAWHLALTKRRDDLPAHPGQVSLPGGYVEPEETTKQAALRELEEELGVDVEQHGEIAVLGNLSPLYIFGTNFFVIPWVAGATRRPDFRPNPAEVGLLYETPIDYLIDPANRGVHPRVLRGIRSWVPHFDWHVAPSETGPNGEAASDKIWGATAMILNEFLTVWREAAAVSESEAK